MTGNVSQASNVAVAPLGRDTSIRIRAVAIFVLLLAELLLGNQLAVVGTPYPVGYLATHIVLSILLIGLAAHVVVRSTRSAERAGQGSRLAHVRFHAGRHDWGNGLSRRRGSSIALYAMEGLGALAVLGAVLLIVWGSVRIPSQPTTT